MNMFLSGVACIALAMAATAHAGEVTVSAAASLTNAFHDIAAAFSRENPTVTVHTNYASSNALLKQMESGAPVDVVATADQQTMDKAQQAKLIDPATRADFVSNTLVMVVPGDFTVVLESAAGLTQDAVRRIAIGTPASVPAGRYAKEALTSLGVWDALAPKFVYGSNVRQVLDYVKRGEVEAGIVYGSDALAAREAVKVVCVMSGHRPVRYPIAVTTMGSGKQEVRSFFQFITSPKGMEILKKHGLAETR